MNKLVEELLIRADKYIEEDPERAVLIEAAGEIVRLGLREKDLARRAGECCCGRGVTAGES